VTKQIFSKIHPLVRIYNKVTRELRRCFSSALDRMETVRSVKRLITGLPREVQLRFLSQMDPARVVSLVSFQDFFLSRKANIADVAVVSGSLREPELIVLGEGLNPTLLSYEENPQLFDLAKDWSGADWSDFRGAYDLVLCEQVLEHVVSPQRAVENISFLLRPGGYLHIGVPSVNNRHGEPTYFYSGFAQETLEIWARGAGLDVLEVSSFCSNKGSRMYSTSDWAPLAQSGPPIFFSMALRLLWRYPRKAVAVWWKRLLHLALYPMQPFFPIRSSKNAVISWIVAKKPPEPSLGSEC